MEKYKAFEGILTNLNILRYIIYSKVNLGYYDTNKQVENLYRDLLNMVFGWQLKNKNEDKKNYPGLDLLSTKDKIGIQVTSQTTHLKVDNTLELVNKHCSSEVDRIIVFILTKKSNHTKKFKSSIRFDKKNDILDLDDLLTEIEKMSTEDVKKIAEYVSSEVPYYIGKITSKDDILRHRADYSSIKAKNCSKFKAISDKPRHVEQFADSAEEIYQKLHSISQRQRIGLFVFFTKCDQEDLELDIGTWVHVMEASFNFSRADTINCGRILENKGLMYNNEDENSPMFQIPKSNHDFWLDLLSLLPNKNHLYDLIVNLNFSLLDE